VLPTGIWLHEALLWFGWSGTEPGCGSFEVRFEDGRPSVFFYFEDLPGRRLRPDLVTSEVALEQAKGFREG
jgi:hypothetical protein